jgi:Mg2+ and Co2+ transporter CorA
VRLDDPGLPDLGDDHMLWADVDLESAEGLDQLWEKLGIAEIIPSLAELDDRPRVVRHNGLIQLNVHATGDGAEFEPMALHCLVGTNWIVTLHQGELDLVDEFNKPFHGETLLGELDGPAFLSMVLDWQLGGYFSVIEALQTDIDHLDEELLHHSPKQVTDEVTLLQRLQELRQRVRKLRQTLSPHREVFGLLSHPESDAVVGSDAAPDYERLAERLQLALDAVDTTREMIVGSFDIFMTRTAQATNDIMKRLTIVSVLLLPAGVIAGIMGMNFEVGIFERPWMFWVTLGVMATLASITLVVAKRQKWI